MNKYVHVDNCSLNRYIMAMPKTRQLSRKIRILAYGDSPTVPSGFGTVMKNIFYHLGKTGRYDIDLFGINDRIIPHSYS